MTTLQIQIDESTAEAIRRKAEIEGKTPEAWVAEVAARQARPQGNNAWIKKFLEDANKNRGDSRGWKWNRDELYDR